MIWTFINFPIDLCVLPLPLAPIIRFVGEDGSWMLFILTGGAHVALEVLSPGERFLRASVAACVRAKEQCPDQVVSLRHLPLVPM